MTANPTGQRRGWTLALASVGAFMSALDVVVVSTALPTLREHFGASLADLEWTINAYSVFGVAIMAAIFAGNGGYSGPATFIAGFRPAEWAAAGIAAAGVVAAALAPSRRQLAGLADRGLADHPRRVMAR
jgi:MFS family permease